MRRTALAAWLLLAGCGLARTQPIDFRTYPLRGIRLVEAREVLRDVTARFFTERFGGVGIAWDGEQDSLETDPVIRGERRLKLYARVLAVENGVEVELLALVHHLQSGTSPAGMWGRPMMDVPLEEMLHRAMLAAILERQGGTR